MTLLLPVWLKLVAAVRQFRQQPPTPERTFAFEENLAMITREANRLIVEHEYNRIEPACFNDCPLRLRFAGEEYRRRPKSPKRIGTLFGEIDLRRYLYEAVEPGERLGDLLAVHRLDHVEKENRVMRLIGLQGANEMQFETGVPGFQRRPFF